MSDAKIIDFGKKKAENIEQKKRQFERILFSEFVGCYSVVDDNGTVYPIDLVDISAKGCMVEVPKAHNPDKQFLIDSEVKIRLYFTKKSYIPVVFKIRHRKETVNDKGKVVVRYGGEFDTTLPSFQAVESFIKFVYQFAAHSRIEEEGNKVYFL
jgi:hypothetical protein